MIRTRSTSLLFLTFIALFLVACGGIAATEADIKPVLQAVAAQSAVIVDQNVPDPASPNGQDANVAPTNSDDTLGQLFAHEQAFIDLFENSTNSVVHVGVG